MSIVLGKEIGTGGFASVYEGFDDQLGRRVAVKIVRASAELVSSALDHAKALARVNHPNVVTVYSIATVDDPATSRPCDAVIMELVEGEPLSTRLKGARLTREEVRSIGIALIDGVDHIHKQGITHEDIHEENVLVVGSTPKIIDIFYRTSLRSLSPNSRESRVRRDLGNLKELLEAIISASEVDSRQAERFRSLTGRTAPLDGIRDALIATLARAPDQTAAPQLTPWPVPEQPSASAPSRRTQQHSPRRMSEGDANKLLDELDRLIGLDDGEAAWGLLDHTQIALIDTGKSGDLLPRYRRLLKLIRPGTSEYAAILGNAGVCYDQIGDSVSALKYYRRSLALEKKLSSTEGQANQLSNIGVAYHGLGEITKAKSYFERALALDLALQRAAQQSKNLDNIGLCLTANGDASAALDFHKRAANLAATIDEEYLRMRALRHVGDCYEALGHVPKALALHAETLDLARRLGLEHIAGMQLCIMGNCYYRMGALAEALASYQQSLQSAEATEDLIGQAANLCNLGSCYASLDEPSRASELFQRSLNLYRRMSISEAHPHFQLLLKNIARTQSNT